ncbi:MAG: Bifunctional polymyxin resistance protein ArnA [Planctomycetota bacterium]
MRPEQKLRIAWVGFHQEGIRTLRWLRNSGIRLEAILTLDEPALAKRSAGGGYEDVTADWDVPVFRISSINDPEVVQLLHRLSLDLVFVIGWSQILHREALATARVGVIGAHASLLPHNRGSAPINWALIRNEKSTGNSLIWLTEEVDEGRLIDQISFPITPFDTCATLYERVAESNQIMIERVLGELFAGRVPGAVQEVTSEPLLPRRRPADGLIQWAETSETIYNFVRALTRPYPGAFSFLDRVRWTVQACALLPGTVTAEAAGRQFGEIVGASLSPCEDACGLVIQCGVGQLLLLEIEDLEGRVLRGRELALRGLDQPGEVSWTGRTWLNE